MPVNPDKNISEDDAVAIAKAHDIAELFHEMLHLTVVGAHLQANAFPKESREARKMYRQGRVAMHKLVDKIIEFAMEDD